MIIIFPDRYNLCTFLYYIHRELAYIYRNSREDQFKKYKPISNFTVWQFIFFRSYLTYNMFIVCCCYYYFLLSQLPFPKVRIDNPQNHLHKKAENKNHCSYSK